MLSEHLHMAMSSIRTARFRTFLTMSGVIIGVVSVITTFSLGDGIKHQIAGQASTAGSDLITVRPGKLVKRDSDGKVSGVNLLSFLSSSKITEKDLETIKKNPNIQTAVPYSIINGVPSYNKKQFNDGFIMGTTKDMPEVSNRVVEFGNFFDESDSDRQVAVIGYGVAEKLFEENVPLGKTFQLRGQDFIVGGVFERTPNSPLNPEADFNNGVYISVADAKTLAGTDIGIYEIQARPKSKELADVNKAVASIKTGLRSNHAGEEDFTVLRQDEIIAVADNLLGLVTNTVTIMAIVTLFVGGIGIMNVMLVSVTERTREIGIRKAVGATNHQIQMQFLIEAIVISVWGALIGIFLSGLINLFFRITTNLEPIITWEIVLISAFVSIAVGIVFGMIPAIKASRKDPIEALRSF